MTQPAISILLPTYNGAQTIARAIESVLAQSFLEWELLVLDDGSTDTTAKIVQEFAAADSRISYIQNENNLGIQKTLNKGLSLAQGEYIARIDDDDAWIDPQKLQLQYAYVHEHPECGLVGTGVIVVDEKGWEISRHLPPATDQEIRKYMLFRNCFIHSSVLFQKNMVQAIGGYGESGDARHVEDYDLWLRIGTQGEMANIPIYGVRFLLSARNISSKHMHEQYKKNIALISKHRKEYPNYFFGLIVGYIRLIGASLLGSILSPKTRGKVIGVYKNLLK